MRAALLFAVLGIVLVGTMAPRPASGQDPRDVWLDLLYEGQIDEARQQLVVYAGGLPPVEATKILRWVEAIARTEDEDRATVAAAIVLNQRATPQDAVEVLTERASGRTDDAAPHLIALAVRFAAAAGDSVEANELRAQLVESFPSHDVTPEALLDLAKYRISHGEALEETAAAVETLIVEQPMHPLVPTARQLLSKLQGGW